jgi:ABC-type spermidine/putrescine transport system permease subunit I
MRRYLPSGAVAPLLILYGFFFFFPQIYFLRLAFSQPADLGATLDGFTVKTVTDLFTTEFYRNAIIRTIQLCIISAVSAVVIAYPLAYVIVTRRRSGGLVFVVVVATMFSSAVAHVLGWKVLLSVNGPINDLVLGLGISSSPWQMSNNFTAVVIGTVHAVLPIAVIALMPVCEAVAKDQLQAATALGASDMRGFFQVFLPQTLPGVISVALLVFAVTASAFTTPVLLGGGKVAVLSILIYSDATTTLNYSRAAALSLVLLLITAGAVALALILARRSSRSRVRSVL